MLPDFALNSSYEAAATATRQIRNGSLRSVCYLDGYPVSLVELAVQR